jgi:hypothetical protein
MADVFISYSSKNRDHARSLANALSDLGLSVWWDREIVTGQAFDSVIERELDAARSVVVLWSRDSVESEWVKNEAALAAERGILLPVTIDGTRPPLEFRRKQTADLSGWNRDPGNEGFQALCRAIHGMTGNVSSPTVPITAARAPVRARRWGVGGTALAIAVILGIAGVYLNRYGRNDPSRDIVTDSNAPKLATGEPKGTHASQRGLADVVVGTYDGEVIADSKGNSRSNVVVTITRLDPATVQVTSSYGRIGTLEVELTQVDEQVLNASGDTTFIVDLAAAPPTLSLDPHGELAYRGRLRQ